MFQYLILTLTHAKLWLHIGLMKPSVFGRSENYSNCVAVLVRIRYLKRPIISRHFLGLRQPREHSRGDLEKKPHSSVWVLPSLQLGNWSALLSSNQEPGNSKLASKSDIGGGGGRGGGEGGSEEGKNKTKLHQTSLMMRFRASLALFKIHTHSPND